MPQGLWKGFETEEEGETLSFCVHLDLCPRLAAPPRPQVVLAWLTEHPASPLLPERRRLATLSGRRARAGVPRASAPVPAPLPELQGRASPRLADLARPRYPPVLSPLPLCVA